MLQGLQVKFYHDVGDARSPAPGVTVCDGTDPEGNPFSIENK